jgi:hypothetical protein
MKQENKPAPTWIVIISTLLVLFELVISFALCFFSQATLDALNITAKGVDHLVYIWAARQFALAFIFAFAALKKSIPMLTIAYVFLLVMNLGDAITGIVLKDHSVIIGALVWCVVSTTLLYFLNRINHI